MKICSVCLKSDYLCGGCAKRLDTGAITKTDIDLSRALFKLGIDTDFIKSFDEGGVFVLANKKQSGLLIGRAGRNAKKLSEAMGKDVRIVEHTDDEKRLIERITGAQVLGINKFYGDSEIYKVRLEKKFRYRAGNMPSVVGKMMNKTVQFVFE